MADGRDSMAKRNFKVCVIHLDQNLDKTCISWQVFRACLYPHAVLTGLDGQMTNVSLHAVQHFFSHIRILEG